MPYVIIWICLIIFERFLDVSRLEFVRISNVITDLTQELLIFLERAESLPEGVIWSPFCVGNEGSRHFKPQSCSRWHGNWF